MRRLCIYLIALATLVISLFNIGGYGLVNAQTRGQGLEISPPLIEIKADPGEVIETTISLRNVTEETLVTSSEINDFVSAGEDGQPRLLLEENQISPYSIKAWISTIPSIDIASREQHKIPIKIRVPQDASPGGHYGVVRFTGYPDGLDNTGVSLSASIGTLILVRVSGDTTEQASIEELFTMTQEGEQRGIFEYGPITLVERIKNSGNVHIKPTGTISVTNMFNKNIASFQLNENGGNVLPYSVRRFEQTLEKHLLFGRYTMNADVVYGSENKIISDSVTFWVIPYKLILIAIALIFLLIFMIKKYNRYVVKRSIKKAQ